MKKKVTSLLLVLFLCAGCGSYKTLESKMLPKETTTVVSLSETNVEQIGLEDTDSKLEDTENKLEDTDSELEDAEIKLEDTDAKEETIPEVSDQEVSLIMVGDILLHTRVEETAKLAEGGYDYTALFANMKEEIAAADIALVNEEVIIGGEELGVSGYPAFNAPYEVADALVDTGFDIVLHATNHALDKGKKGILNCLSNWETKYPEMEVLGIYASEEQAEDLLIVEKEGMSIAILNYTYGTNGISLPTDMPYAVDMLEEEKVISDLERAKSEADFVVVCPHWGTEYRLEPDAYQQKWTKLFLEHEVDLVIGTHPHVIEPIEWIVSEETGHEMLVYYSLGNFVNWTSGTGAGVSNRMVGGMAEITLGYDVNGDVIIKEYGVEAICSHVTPEFGGVTVYPLSQYTQELAKENAIISQAPDFSRDYAVELCNQVWGDLWR